MAFKLTQLGGNNPQTKTSGTLQFGKTYEIVDLKLGDDFIIGGAPDNNIGTKFIANGIQPTWSNGSEIGFNDGIPVISVDVYEENLDKFWFEFLLDGNYYLKSKGLFSDKTVLKAFINTQGTFGSIDSPKIFANVLNADTIHIETLADTGAGVVLSNDVLFNAYFELDIN